MKTAKKSITVPLLRDLEKEQNKEMKDVRKQLDHSAKVNVVRTSQKTKEKKELLFDSINSKKEKL